MSVSVVVLGFLDEPWFEDCIESLLASVGVDVQVIVVDNGCTNGAIERIETRFHVQVVRPKRNLGFAGGCNLGAQYATGEYVAFVSSDTVVRADTLSQLAEAASRPGVGIVSGSIRLGDDPELLQSAGSYMHFLGLVWAGHLGEPAALHSTEKLIACACGAGMALRKSVWDQLGGFDETYFAYHEDAELSIRCWQQGLSVVYIPGAVVVHRYEFSRNPTKFYLMERNRLILLLTLYEARTLGLIVPAALLFEPAALAVSVLQGWSHHKLRSWFWIFGHMAWIKQRRRLLQSQRSVSDRELAHLFVGRFESTAVRVPKAGKALNLLLEKYWLAIRRLV